MGSNHVPVLYSLLKGDGEIIKNELREMKFNLIEHQRSDMTFLPGVK